MLAGSFDDWRKHEMTFVPDVGYHILVTELPPGQYFYRFVVDGRWKIAEGDPNLKEDQFGEMSHFLQITPSSLAAATPKRFSTAVIAHADPADVGAEPVVEQGQSDTESESEEFDPVEEAPLPRMRDSIYVKDYDDDACGDFDLQADVFEAMKDVAETTTIKDAPLTDNYSQSTQTEKSNRRRFKRRPGARMLRKVWGMMFGDIRETENIDPHEERSDAKPTRNQKAHAIAGKENAKKGIKVWFPNEKKRPKDVKGRKVAPSETKEVIDVGEQALRLHQAEENANTRQMLGKTLFAQGKYDAALALFSLSVKLREDNGLKYAKTTAIAHTDVASAFIHLEDLKNGEKHLNRALAIYKKGTFSGGKSQLGDVHCFLGVIGDMRADLRVAEIAYRTAIETYKESRATETNPNYATAIENLNANLRRQRMAPQRPPRIEDSSPNVEDVALKAPRHDASRQLPPLPKPQPKLVQPPPPPRTVVPPRPLEPSRPAPQVHVDTLSTLDDHISVAPKAPSPLETKRSPPEPERSEHPGNERPKTWEDLAETARASMPEAPPAEDIYEEETEAPVGQYEEMSRSWHKDGSKLLASGKYKEAIDLYTLAIYTRKRHGPWNTRENAETLVEHARALFATRELEESVKIIRDAVAILEKLDSRKNGVFLGEVWGNLGSVLDRLGGHGQDALTAHCAGMVAYGRSGMSTEDVKWLKAWKGLCVNLKMNDQVLRKDEIWQSIDLQIRGVAPITKVANVRRHR